MRAESAPTVLVEMDRGPGHRGGYGGGRGGFGADRRGRGRGRNPARNLTWERADKGKAEEPQESKDPAKELEEK